jgi:hypothetical protein
MFRFERGRRQVLIPVARSRRYLSCRFKREVLERSTNPYDECARFCLLRNHRVLENDIDLNEIFSLAAPAGFTQVKVRVMNDLSISLEQDTPIRLADCAVSILMGCSKPCRTDRRRRADRGARQ